MPQVKTNGTITDEGASYISQRVAQLQPIEVSHFVLANLPGVTEDTEADPTLTLADIPNEQRVGINYPIYRIGYADDHHVAYSLHLDGHQGDFDFNWIGMVTSTGELFAFVNIPMVYKRKDLGQTLTHSILTSYSAARILNPASVPAESWQFNHEEILGSLVISLTGENWIHLGETKKYVINDFDEMGVYLASANIGDAVISGREVTLSMPESESPGTAQLTISRNGYTRAVAIEIRPQTIEKPSMLTPVDGAVDMISNPILSCSSFVVYPSTADSHRSSDWEIMNDQGSVIWSSYNNTTAKTSIQPPHGVLDVANDYSARVRHKGNTVTDSEWSEPTHFRTADSFYAPGRVVDGFICIGQLNGYWYMAPMQNLVKQQRIHNSIASMPPIGLPKYSNNNALDDDRSGAENLAAIKSSNLWVYVKGHAFGYADGLGCFIPSAPELKFLFDNISQVQGQDGGLLESLVNTSARIWTSTLGSAGSDLNFHGGAVYSSSTSFGERYGQESSYYVVPMKRVPV
jgi:hypothetical protein